MVSDIKNWQPVHQVPLFRYFTATHRVGGNIQLFLIYKKNIYHWGNSPLTIYSYNIRKNRCMKRVYLILHFARKGDKKCSYYLSIAKEKKLNIHSFQDLSQITVTIVTVFPGWGGGGLRGGEGGLSLPSAMFLKSVKKGWCWEGWGETRINCKNNQSKMLTENQRIHCQM